MLSRMISNTSLSLTLRLISSTVTLSPSGHGALIQWNHWHFLPATITSSTVMIRSRAGSLPFQRTVGYDLDDHQGVIQHVELYANAAEVPLQGFIYLLDILAGMYWEMRIEVFENFGMVLSTICSFETSSTYSSSM